MMLLLLMFQRSDNHDGTARRCCAGYGPKLSALILELLSYHSFR